MKICHTVQFELTLRQDENKKLKMFNKLGQFYFRCSWYFNYYVLLIHLLRITKITFRQPCPVGSIENRLSREFILRKKKKKKFIRYENRQLKRALSKPNLTVVENNLFGASVEKFVFFLKILMSSWVLPVFARYGRIYPRRYRTNTVGKSRELVVTRKSCGGKSANTIL